ncbi:MAG TPA: protein kinase, partial [Thermoanaerobaculia bacterium]|nr:protein kinase [Thermoanaerobaculia bacterium]
MQMQPGMRLGRYEIVAAVGAGGMGEVYRAVDTRLDRSVAIKVLPKDLSQNDSLRQRFEREARTISSLSHPHICGLFDVGHEDGVDYLVMELLEGETLAERLTRGPLPLEQALRCAIEIASALEKAHKQGIVHRDLKPANVMLTKGGAKLLDFGLARIAEGEPGHAMEGSTQHMPLTEEGTILGTVQYMAPEQLEGKEADARTDLFALGALLYEMVAGRRPFDGTSRASVIAAIMERQPRPISDLQPLTPPALERVVRTCLAKDPDERWQSAHDVGAELRWIAEGTSQPNVLTPAPVVRRRRLAQRLAWLAAGLVAGALLASAAWMLAREKPRDPVMRFAIETDPRAAMFVMPYQNLAIAPDGETIAYIGVAGKGTQLYMRKLDRLRATPIAGTEGAVHPFFSPDGRWIAFTSAVGEGELRKVAVDGGAPVTIDRMAAGLGGWWGDDGTIWFVNRFNEGIWRLPAGGKPELAIRPDSKHGERALISPQPLPGGTHVLATAWTGKTWDEARIIACPVDGSERKVLVEGGTFGRVVSSGHLVFARGGVLFAAPFDAKRLEVTGNPVPVLPDVNSGIANGEVYLAEAKNGTLLYAPGIISSPPRELVWVDREGKEQPAVPTARLYGGTALSPDGTMVAVGIEESQFDIWTVDLERDVATRLSFGEDDGDPVFS